ncbi:hypothetical protein GGR06_002614 [Bacteroides reticulotermitis]|uniref:Uncharacterized protein n=3 Tax=Bacteroides reticulotermitis TaxID=1133319 RepID=W4UX83_9BACE|nr:hypothetical protein [Bacteroides reticulotermitis]MBB4044816.1 hypothetical protein [Bacteroides reticulotermitis]GAE85556.1 hypothetical protein JCM10512_4002 [Bacteroides reticulotermitis JCM 10512]
MASLSLLLDARCLALDVRCLALDVRCFGFLDVRCLALGCSLFGFGMLVASLLDVYCPRLSGICPALRRSLPWASSP